MPERPLDTFLRETTRSPESKARLVRALNARRREAARLRRPWSRLWGLALVPVAALGVLFVPPPGPTELGTSKGGDGSPRVDLELAIRHDGDLQEADANRRYAAGDEVFFRLHATAPAAVAVWVVGPDGETTPLTNEQVAANTPHDVGGREVAYVLPAASPTAPATYTFYASAQGLGRCEAPGCAQVALEVE